MSLHTHFLKLLLTLTLFISVTSHCFSQANETTLVARDHTNRANSLVYSEELQLASDDNRNHVTLNQLWQEQKPTMQFIIILILAIILNTFYALSIRRKLASSESELHQHRNYLDELVKERTDEINQQADHHKKTAIALTEANQFKSDFISQMSHEMRTPLNAILGYGQLIKMDTVSSPDIHENTKEILAAGHYLLTLINEILDISKIESGNQKLMIEAVEWAEIISESISLVTPIANKHNITIVMPDLKPCHVLADRKQLKQICINLLSNAIKYNKTNGQIEIKHKALNNGLCQLTIKDNGIGIKEKFQDKVFTPFSREKNNAGHIEGTGIGLAITKKLLENMNGKIDFSSEFGNGSEFRITLPVPEKSE